MTNRWTGLVVTLALAVFALTVFPALPEQIPAHWNAAGEADRWIAKWPGMIFAPATALAIWALAHLLPRTDPRRDNYGQFGETYWLVINLTILLVAALQVLAVGEALRWPVRIGSAVIVVTGLFFVALGNYLPRVRSNWWMGIRTPWTLADGRVWRETHRVGGRSFVAGGLLIVASALLPPLARQWVVLGAITIAALVPAIYSYLSWRRGQKRAT